MAKRPMQANSMAPVIDVVRPNIAIGGIPAAVNPRSPARLWCRASISRTPIRSRSRPGSGNRIVTEPRPGFQPLQFPADWKVLQQPPPKPRKLASEPAPASAPIAAGGGHRISQSAHIESADAEYDLPEGCRMSPRKGCLSCELPIGFCLIFG